MGPQVHIGDIRRSTSGMLEKDQPHLFERKTNDADETKRNPAGEAAGRGRIF